MTNKTFDLDNIRVASPCPASWEDMAGDDRVRFCGECKLNVYNLSAMQRDEAEDLVRNREKRLCVRFYQRNDGTVLTRDCPVGLRAIARRARARIAAVASFMFVFLLGCGRSRAEQIPPLQGDVLVPPTGVELGEVFLPPTGTELLGGMKSPQEDLPLSLGRVLAPNHEQPNGN